MASGSGTEEYYQKRSMAIGTVYAWQLAGIFEKRGIEAFSKL
jgi:hypothetical protein